MEQITINKQTLPVKEYKGKRVVTFKEIDKVHGRADGTASRNFRVNKNHFINGVDYFKVSPDEFRRTIGTMDKRQPNDITLITESGYLMLAKSFTDELAWNVQRELVNTYFRKSFGKTAAPEPEQLTLETSEYFYFPKTYNGEPVLTLWDIEHFTKINSGTLSHFVRKYCEKGKDFILLEGDALYAYKRENPNASKLSSTVLVITKSGCERIAKAYGCVGKLPKLIAEKSSTISCF